MCWARRWPSSWYVVSVLEHFYDLPGYSFHICWSPYWPCSMQNFGTETNWGPLLTKLLCGSVPTKALFNQKLHYLSKFRLQQNCNYNLQIVFFKTNNNVKKSFSSLLAAYPLRIRDDIAPRLLLFSFCCLLSSCLLSMKEDHHLSWLHGHLTHYLHDKGHSKSLLLRHSQPETLQLHCSNSK